MHWKQFFTPVQSINCTEAKELLKNTSQDLTILDVRQPAEYQEGHLPGARLIPLPLLASSWEQLMKETTTLVYCRSGGRSRVAAQMLIDAGFSSVINLEGGMMAWNGIKAFGDSRQGLHLFGNLDSLDDILKTAFSLEEGLQDFYLQMMRQAGNHKTSTLFQKLSDIEDIHKERIYREYVRLSGQDDRKVFQEDIEKNCLEGGCSTEEYMALFQPDLKNSVDIIELAMSIEGQAQDLYTRASRLATQEESKKTLLHIAQEESFHLEQLGTLLDTLLESNEV